MINIGLCADENFAMPFGVCLTSLFESNKNEPITVHVITQGFSDKTLSRIRTTEQKYARVDTVKIYKIDDGVFSQYPLSTQFPKSIYFRYLYAKLLPESIERLLYIDCDTVVLSSLKDIWNADMPDGILFGAVEDRNGDDILIRNRIGRWDGFYFNSGVLLMNLAEWRRMDTFKIFADFILENKEVCLYPDQDAINAAFPSRFKRLPFEYNFHMSFVAPFNTFRLHLSKKIELLHAFKNLCIVHFAAEIKPWYKDSQHPLIFLWLYFYNKSEWRVTKLKYRNSLIRRIMRKFIIRLFYNNLEQLDPSFEVQLQLYRQLYTLHNNE